MKLQEILVPSYVAEAFERPLGHPSSLPNAVARSIQRVHCLIADALLDVADQEWEVDEGVSGSATRNEPFGFYEVGGKFIIYSEEKGARSAIAVFKSRYMAADYFVWLVSRGRREIDWSSRMDMEP